MTQSQIHIPPARRQISDTVIAMFTAATRFETFGARASPPVASGYIVLARPKINEYFFHCSLIKISNAPHHRIRRCNNTLYLRLEFFF